MVPLRPMHGFNEVRAAAAFVTRAARAREPKLFTFEVRPARRRGRIRIDVERNRAGAGLISAFSARRTRPWSRCRWSGTSWSARSTRKDFPVAAVRARLDAVGNPLRGFFEEPQSIEPILAGLRARRGSETERGEE